MRGRFGWEQERIRLNLSFIGVWLIMLGILPFSFFVCVCVFGDCQPGAKNKEFLWN